MKKLRNTLFALELCVCAFLFLGYARKKIQNAAETAVCWYLGGGAEDGITVLAKNAVKDDGEKRVALTFDDGPNECYTMELLEGLKSREVRATFFLIGKKAEECPDIVKEIQKDGHLIGNHSYDHVNLSEMTEGAACEQIEKTNQVIEEITGEAPQYLRPPFGSYKKNLDADMNMVEVLWDVDPRDWSVKNTGMVVSRVTGQVEDGDIILLHDEYATSVAAAFEIIDILKSKGYTFVTVDELIFE